MNDGPIIYTRGDIAIKAALATESILREALKTRGSATLMVSGGSSPKPLYESLSHADLDWSRVTVSLVDERWVDPGHPGSNEDFIRGTLLQNKARNASFIGLKTKHKTVEAGLRHAASRLEDIEDPFDICIMGMGSDAHSASWFSNSKGLEAALSPYNKKKLCAINASSAPVAGNFPDRISLTLNAVLQSHAVFLFIPGAAKRAVWDDVSNRSIYDAPVKALLTAGSKLHVFASPQL